MDPHHQDRHHGVHYHKHNSGQHSHENGHMEHDAIARNYSIDSLREHWYRQGHHTRRRSSIAHRAIKRVESVARRMSMPAFDIDRIEQGLDEEIKEETEELQREATESVLVALRRSGEQILHSKKILLIVVILNIIDCALVMTELILDIHFIKDMVNKAETVVNNFGLHLQEKFPDVFGGMDAKEMYHRVLDSASLYNYHKLNNTNANQSKVIVNGGNHGNVTYRIKRNADDISQHASVFDMSEIFTSNEHTTEEVISHAFHKASITILGILVLITLLKLFCYGTRIFKKKLELFDGIIVIVSFVLDLVFLKGILGMEIEEGAEVLTLLVPWRVIRVVNSLIVAISDEAHLQLKMVYKQKKTSDEKRDYAEKEVEYHKKIVSALSKMCCAYDIPSTVVTACVNSVQDDKPTKKEKKISNSSVFGFKNFPGCVTARHADQRPSMPYGHIDDCSMDNGHLSPLSLSPASSPILSTTTSHHSLPAITLYEVDEEQECENEEDEELTRETEKDEELERQMEEQDELEDRKEEQDKLIDDEEVPKDDDI